MARSMPPACRLPRLLAPLLWPGHKHHLRQRPRLVLHRRGWGARLQRVSPSIGGRVQADAVGVGGRLRGAALDLFLVQLQRPGGGGGGARPPVVPNLGYWVGV